MRELVLTAALSACGLVAFAQVEDAAPSVRPLTDGDFEAGIVLAHVGTGEQFDFAPSGSGKCWNDWLERGASRDWFRADFANLDFGLPERDRAWSFAMATNVVRALTVLSQGTVRPSIADAGTCISPLDATLGIVPAENYGLLDAINRPCQFWYGMSDRETLLLTWRNVLLDRDVGRPVSFQAEIDRKGTVTFRYDLSRLPEPVVTNVSVGILNGGKGRVFTRLPRELTSLRWAYLDPRRGNALDHDGDGLSTSDEIFEHFTDPYSADTDGDGLTDRQEIYETHSDPCNAYSLDPRFDDRYVSALKGMDPYSSPNEDGFTAVENIFYTGSATGKSVPPVSDASTAVLEIASSGGEGGYMNIGSTRVPVLPGGCKVKVAIPRGVRCDLEYDASLKSAPTLNSEDFCVGESAKWLEFPFVEATHPCLHRFDSNSAVVSLDPGSGMDDLTCTWASGDGQVEVKKLSTHSAKITPVFKRDETASISYTLAHPDYMFGKTTFSQICEYCPKIRDEEGYSSTSNYPAYYDVANRNDPLWCKKHKCRYKYCWWIYHEKESGESDAEEEPEEEAPTSSSNKYYQALHNRSQFENVLKLHRPEETSKKNTKKIEITVPEEKCHCCSCRDHWSSSASVGYKSHRLSATFGDEPFVRTTESGELSVSGSSPSEDFEDSELTICTNGVTQQTLSYTVIGVSIVSDEVNLPHLNEVNSAFGLPVIPTMDMAEAIGLDLCVDVDLPSGYVHLAFEDISAHMQLWMMGKSGSVVLLLDSDIKPTLDMTLANWREYTEAASCGNAVSVLLVAVPGDSFGETPRSAKLYLGYAGGKGGKYLHDEATQEITVVEPLLLPDYDRNGGIDKSDAYSALRRPFHFWTNADIWRDDNAFDPTFLEKWFNLGRSENGSDDEVNGRNDLVNLLPLAINIQQLVRSWGDECVGVTVRSRQSDVVRRCYSDLSWDKIKTGVLSDIKTDDESSWLRYSKGDYLRESELKRLDYEGDTLPQSVIRRSLNRAGVVYLEADRECDKPVEIVITLDGEEMLRYIPNIRFSEVEKMYRWHDIRGAAKDVNSVDYSVLPSPEGWPDEYRDDANLYFVHGYNVSEQEAREWGQAFFKRMWWSGLNAKMHVVTWFGNDSQFWLSGAGLVAPDYHVNVEHAIQSSEALARIANSYPGRNYFAAHSLGNMLVSSAIHDRGLNYEKYFMLNAAVAAEAYDPDKSITDASLTSLTPKNWRGVPNRYRASHWFELEEFASDDARRNLTWHNRFSNVDRAVNYYSSEEEVLKCDPNGEDKWKIQREWAWYTQERGKGDMPPMAGRNEGGWEYNGLYKTLVKIGDDLTGYLYKSRDPSVDELVSCAEDLREEPAFKPFEDSSLMTTNLVLEITEAMTSQLLADAIPAESFPAGFSAVNAWAAKDSHSINKNMSTEYKSLAGISDFDGKVDWGHSYFLGAPYMVVYKLFDDMKERIK